jgi:hypothetical protein
VPIVIGGLDPAIQQVAENFFSSMPRSSRAMTAEFAAARQIYSQPGNGKLPPMTASFD